MNHYPRHIGDIAKDTAHLSQGQFGAYDLLLDWYYAHEKPLPIDRTFLFAITRAKSKTERENTEAVLRWFFTEQADGWHQKRCDEELARFAQKSAKAAASASARWGLPHSDGNANASADAMRTHPKRIPERNASHKPVTSNQEESKASVRTATDGAVDKSDPPGKERPSARGTRLPKSWVLPKAWGQWALDEQPTWDRPHCLAVAETFRDYWIAQPGQRGVKTDWEATWRNWVRKEGPKANGNGASRNGQHAGPAWWSSDALILAEGKRLGKEPRPGESMPQFKGRVEEARMDEQRETAT